MKWFTKRRPRVDQKSVAAFYGMCLPDLPIVQAPDAARIGQQVLAVLGLPIQFQGNCDRASQYLAGHIANRTELLYESMPNVVDVASVLELGGQAPLLEGVAGVAHFTFVRTLKDGKQSKYYTVYYRTGPGTFVVHHVTDALLDQPFVPARPAAPPQADIRFHCPHCTKSLVIAAKGVGLTVACPDCKQKIVVPSPAGSPPHAAEAAKTYSQPAGGSQKVQESFLATALRELNAPASFTSVEIRCLRCGAMHAMSSAEYREKLNKLMVAIKCSRCGDVVGVCRETDAIAFITSDRAAGEGKAGGKTARFIKKANYNGDARLYELSTPIDYEGGQTKHAVVMVTEMMNGRVAALFPANQKGEILDWGDWNGTRRYCGSHEQFLSGIGFETSE
jgi:transcription elongation factor Elf1